MMAYSQDWSRHEQPYARSQSVSSPASSGGTPSPRVLPFVIPHRGRTGSGSGSDKQHDGGRDSSTGRGRASPRPVRSAAAVRHRGRSTSPQVLPWRVAPEPLLQPRHDHCGPAQMRKGLLMCGSRRMALVLPPVDSTGSILGGEIWYAAEDITPSSALDLKGRVVVIDNDLALIWPARKAGALAVIVASDDIPPGCSMQSGKPLAFLKGCDPCKGLAPVLGASREDVVQSRIRPLSHVEIISRDTRDTLKEQDASHDQENQDPQRAAPLSMAKNRKGARARSSGPRRSPSVLSVLRTPNGTRKARRAESSSESDDEPTAQLVARMDALGQSAHSKNNVSGSEHGACQNGEDSSNWIQVGSDFYPAANPTSSKSQESTSCERAGQREAAGQGCEGVAGLLQRWKSPSVTRQANSQQEAPFFEALEAAKPQDAGGFADAGSASSSTHCQAVDGDERAASRPVARVLAVAPPTFSRLSSSSSKTAEKGQGEDGWNDTHGLKSMVDRLLQMDAGEMSRSVRSAFKRFCTSPAALKSVAIHVADAIGCLLTRSASHLKQQEGAKRVRELCRFQRATKGGRGGGDVEIDGIEWSIIDIVVEREESLSTLAAMLARQCQAARPSKAGDCACDACSGRNAAAACAQHLALDDYVARCALATSRTFIASLAVALASHGYREACHRVAACIANLALEHNDLRDLICSNQDILTGLKNLFSNSDQQSIDFSLAALANLSIDPRQAQRLIRHVRMDKVVVVLAAGSTKSQHRGAGLIRNLLFSKESIETISRVDGIVQALERLKSSSETCSETRTRATVALSMIKANPETRGVSGAGLEMKLFYGRSGQDNKDREGSQTNDVEIDEGDSCEMYRDEASNLDADLNTLCIVPLIEDSKQQRGYDAQSSKDKRAKQEESDDATQRQRLLEQQKQFQQMAEILRAKKSKTTGPARDEQRCDSEQKFEGGTETRSENLDQRGDVSSRPGGLAATPNVEAARNLAPREPATELCVSELTMGCAMTPSNLNQGLSKSQHQQPLPQSQIPRLALSPCLGPYKLPVQIIQSPNIITTSNLQRGNLSVPATPRSQGTPSLHARLPRSNSLSSNVLDKRQDDKASHYVPARRASHELTRTSTFSSPSPRHFDTQSLEQQRTGYQFFLNADQRMGGRPQPRDGSISDVAKECGEQNFSDKESPSVQEQVSEEATSKSLPLKWFGLSKYVV